ncbi:hypothetical protein DFH09DRAFT_1088403 [Mycena vulgaris]|nr:hypothetical protein DFH09DRAFT_1088403 [Mycena vulgaris]
MSSKFAIVTHHTGKLPTFSKGEVTALACSEFQDTCQNYCAHKDTATDKQVAIVLGCFEDMKVNNWTRPPPTRARLIALKFPEFMIEFRRKFLRPDWQETTRAEVLLSCMN